MIYLASPWFNDFERDIYFKIIKKMRFQGLDVFVPQEKSLENAWDMPNDIWGREVFKADLEALDKCNEVWVLNFGIVSDSGTAWECGYAYAKGKTVRQLLIASEKEFSLMMLNGCDEFDFIENYLADENKNFEIYQK